MASNPIRSIISMNMFIGFYFNHLKNLKIVYLHILTITYYTYYFEVFGTV